MYALIAKILYKNIGQKIKDLAITSFIVETIGSIIGGIIMWYDTDEKLWSLLIIFGPVVAFVSSWMIYAFGEIVDRLVSIDCNTGTVNSKNEAKNEQHTDHNVTEQGLDNEVKLQDTPSNTDVKYKCPTCFTPIQYGEKECRECGQTIKWR